MHMEKMLPSVEKVIRAIQKGGLKNKHGSFVWPKTGYLFPSRRGSKLPHLNKDVVSHTIVSLRDKFVDENKHMWPDLANQLKKIRSHSGRRHAITEFSSANLPMQMGMAWAQISSPRVYVGYSDLTAECVSDTMVKFDESSKIGQP